MNRIPVAGPWITQQRNRLCDRRGDALLVRSGRRVPRTFRTRLCGVPGPAVRGLPAVLYLRHPPGPGRFGPGPGRRSHRSRRHLDRDGGSHPLRRRPAGFRRHLGRRLVLVACCAGTADHGKNQGHHGRGSVRQHAAVECHPGRGRQPRHPADRGRRGSLRVGVSRPEGRRAGRRRCVQLPRLEDHDHRRGRHAGHRTRRPVPPRARPPRPRTTAGGCQLLQRTKWPSSTR